MFFIFKSNIFIASAATKEAAIEIANERCAVVREVVVDALGVVEVVDVYNFYCSSDNFEYWDDFWGQMYDPDYYGTPDADEVHAERLEVEIAGE